MHYVTRYFMAMVALSALTISTTALAADEEEMIANPVYASWAKHKPGTTISGAMKASVGGREINSDLSSKLLEVTPEKVVVEQTRTTVVPGANIPPSVKKEEIKAKIPKSKLDTAVFGDDMKVKATDAGKEDVEIDGKKYDCTVRNFTSEEDKFTMNGKSWESSDMPGMSVKMESTADTPNGQMKMTITVTKLELK